MGVLPSRESHEYPGGFHFAQSGSHAMAILPLTEHFFPSVDSLAFQQLYAGRDMQSAKYNFSLISPELLRKYKHRAMEQRNIQKTEKGEVTPSPRCNRPRPQPYLVHGQSSDGDGGGDGDRKWTPVTTIDESNYSQFFRDDTNCVSPDESVCTFPDGEEEVCEELQRPNPAAHWRVHEAAKKKLQNKENKPSSPNNNRTGANSSEREGGLHCLPSSLTLSSSSGHPLPNGEMHSGPTETRAGDPAATTTEAAEAAFATTAEEEERDMVNCFFARSPEALYDALVVKPNKGFLVDTNKDMCNLYAAEQRWKEARNIVRAYRRQCKEEDASHSAAGASPTTSQDPPRPRITKEEAEEAARVPPPPLFLRPAPQVIVVRMSREEEESARAAYAAKQAQMRCRKADPPQTEPGGTSGLIDTTLTTAAATRAGKGSTAPHSPVPSLDTLGEAKASMSGDRTSIMSSPSPLHVPTTRHHKFEDDAQYHDGRIYLVEEEGVLYMFAYNTAYVDPRLRVRQQREALLQRQQQHKREEEKHSETPESSSKNSEANPSPSTSTENGANTAAAAAAAATPRINGGGDNDGGSLSHTNRQTSSFYHTASAFGDEGEHRMHGAKERWVEEPSPSHLSATASSRNTSATIPGMMTVPQVESAGECNGEAREGALPSPSDHSAEVPQKQKAAALYDGDAPAASQNGKSSSFSDDEEEEEVDNENGDARCEEASSLAHNTRTIPASTKVERSRVVQQLELVTAARYILPICPVRVVGCNGFAESSCRGTPWLRGYENEPEEDAYVESLPVKPPIMCGGSFIDANIGDKILSRAYLLGFQIYRNVCLDAGLPETLTRPFWTLGLLSNIPLLQISREMRFRMRAAAAEVELGYRGLRDMIKGTENDLQFYIYGFSDILPYLERVSRARLEQAEAEANKAAAADLRGAPSLSNGPSEAETPEEEKRHMKGERVDPSLEKMPVSHLIPTRSSQTSVPKALLLPRSAMEFYTQLTIRGNQTLARVRCEAQESFFRLISESTAPVSTSLFMKPLELSTYDYGGAVRMHLLYNRVTGADELQVLPPPRNLDQLLSDHQRRLHIRCHPRRSGDGKESTSHPSLGKKDDGVEGKADCDEAAAAVAPYLVYTVVHPSRKGRGPSLEHYKRNMRVPDDGLDAHTLDEEEVAAVATGRVRGGGSYAPHQYTYPPDSFVDSDMVVYNVHKGRWEHFECFHHQKVAQRRRRKLQAEATAVNPSGSEQQSPKEDNPSTDTAGKPMEASDEVSSAAVVPNMNSGDSLRLEEDEDQQDIHLEDILLCWIKRRLQSATLRNRADPGWLRDSDGHIVQEGRYYIWGFEQDNQQYFYGLIPKFAKEKRNKRHNTTGGNVHHHSNDNRHTYPSITLGNGSRPLSAEDNQEQRCPVDKSGGNCSARHRNGASPTTHSPSNSVNHAQAARTHLKDKMEDVEVSLGPLCVRENTVNQSVRAPTSTLVTRPTLMHNAEQADKITSHTGGAAPLNVGKDARKQQQQHPQSPPSVGGTVERGLTSAATVNGVGATDPSDASPTRITAPQASGSYEPGGSEASPSLTSSATKSTAAKSAATLTAPNNPPGVASRRSSGPRGTATAGKRGGPHHANPSSAQLPPWCMAVGGAPSGTDAPTPMPRPLLYRQKASNHASVRNASPPMQQPTTQLQNQLASAPAAASYMNAEDVELRQERLEQRGNGVAPPRASPQSRQQRHELHEAGYPISTAVPLGPANTPLPQQSPSSCTSDAGAVLMAHNGSLKSRYPAAQQHPHHPHRRMECGQAPLQVLGHNTSELPPPPPPPLPPPSSPLPPLIPSTAESMGRKQTHQSKPVPVRQQQQPQHHHHNNNNYQQQQQHSQLTGSSPLQPHLHSSTVFMSAAAGQASLRSTSTPTGSRDFFPHHAQQKQLQHPYASHDTRPYPQQQQQQQQTRMSHQSSYSKMQCVTPSTLAGADLQQPEPMPTPYNHHNSQEYPPQIITMPPSNAGPASPPPQPPQASASMNTPSTRYPLHPRKMTNGLQMQQQQQQQQHAPVSSATVAPPPVQPVGNEMYCDVPIASVPPSGSRATISHRPAPMQAPYGPSPQAAGPAMHVAGLQGNGVSSHISSYPSPPPPPPPPPQQQQQTHPHMWPHTYPSFSMKRKKSASAGQGNLPIQSYGSVLSPAPQQHACPQENRPYNANYEGGGSLHNHGGGGNGSTHSNMRAPPPIHANPNIHGTYNRLGALPSASADASQLTSRGTDVSIPMSNASMSQPSGYPQSGAASFSAASVAAAAPPSSMMMPVAEGSTGNLYSPYQMSQYPQQPQQQTNVSGRTAYPTATTVSPPASSVYLAPPLSQQQQQRKQQDSKYSPHTTMQSHNSTNYYGSGSATTGKNVSRGVAVGSDGEDSSGYGDAMRHGSRGAHAAAGKHQLQHPQSRQHQYPNSAAPQPSTYASAPPSQQQWTPHAGNDNSIKGHRRNATPPLSHSGVMDNINAPTPYPQQHQMSPYPQQATVRSSAPVTTVGGGGGGGGGAGAAVAMSAAIVHPSPAMQGANKCTMDTVAMTPASPVPAAAVQQQQQQQHGTGENGPSYYDANAGCMPPHASWSTGGAPPSGPAIHVHVPHPQLQQPSRHLMSPPPRGHVQRQAPGKSKQMFVATKQITSTPNASGTLIRTSAASHQRYDPRGQRRQQEQETPHNPSHPYASAAEASEAQMSMNGNHTSGRTHDSSMGAAEVSSDLHNNSSTAQRFVHNPYAMQ